MLSPGRYSHHHQKLICLIQFQSHLFSWTILIAYSKENLKISRGNTSPFFRPFWIGKPLDKYLPIRTLLYVLFKYILVYLTSFVGTPNSVRILYKTSLLSESYTFLNSLSMWRTSHCTSIFNPVSDECRKSDLHWWSPIISSTYGLNLERRTLNKILYEFDKQRYPTKLLKLFR
jgi:hypothetical protein